MEVEPALSKASRDKDARTAAANTADAKMLFNVVKLKPGVLPEDIELALGEMCNVVKNAYAGEGGFIAGRVLRSAGFISTEGLLGATQDPEAEHIAILTYWRSFEQHEASPADEVFKEKFSRLASPCEETYELGYDILWQGNSSH